MCIAKCQYAYIYLSSANIDLDLFYWSIFIACAFGSTNPQLNIISSWLRELLAEPWWSVEFTASAGDPTSLTIPEWIVSIENTVIKLPTASSITEIILLHKGGNIVYIRNV